MQHLVVGPHLYKQHYSHVSKYIDPKTYTQKNSFRYQALSIADEATSRQKSQQKEKKGQLIAGDHSQWPLLESRVTGLSHVEDFLFSPSCAKPLANSLIIKLKEALSYQNPGGR